MSKAKPPGLRRLPTPDDMRPSARDPEEYRGREVLKFCVPNRMVHDFGSPQDMPAGAPASARFTPGLPTRRPRADEDTTGGAENIQPGVRRP